MTASWDAVVIGAGANGLVSACCLAKAGRRVLVLERGDAAGGQGRVTEFAPGFRAAPLCSDAGWLPPAVSRALGLPAMEVVVPDPTVAVGSILSGVSSVWNVDAVDLPKQDEALFRSNYEEAQLGLVYYTSEASHA